MLLSACEIDEGRDEARGFRPQAPTEPYTRYGYFTRHNTFPTIKTQKIPDSFSVTGHWSLCFRLFDFSSAYTFDAILLSLDDYYL